MKQVAANTDLGAYWSEQEWQVWLAERLDRHEHVYNLEPALLTSAFDREQDYAKDYFGRELLELLQNADDAGEGYEGVCRALLLVTKDGFCVANTGKTFTTRGVESLLISNNSPKRRNRRSYIGNKGLGFRALLNWSDSPTIFSGNLALQFSNARAREWLDELCSKYENIREHIAEVRQDRGKQPALIPTLAVPFAVHDTDSCGEVLTSQGKIGRLLKAARDLRNQGYNTVIAAPFADSSAFDEACAQIKNQARPELLLFVNHLTELTVETPAERVAWCAKREAHQVTIWENDSSFRRWRISKEQGRVPQDLLEAEQKDSPDYTITVALPETVDGHPTQLYSYFPTNIVFPFSVLAHVTAELNSNRQELRDSKANRYIIGRLAHRLAMLASRLPQAGDAWRRLAFVTPQCELSTSLINLGFADALLEESRHRAIIPTLSGRLHRLEHVRWLKGSSRFISPGDWLPKDRFADIALWPEDQHLQVELKKLGIAVLSSSELQTRLMNLPTSMSPARRAALIRGLVTNDLLSAGNVPDLLVDAAGRTIPAEATVFLPPADGNALNLPHWVNLRMLSGDLITALRAELKISDNRDLLNRLRHYHLRAYSMEALAQVVKASLDTAVASHPKTACDYYREAIGIYYALYSQNSRGNEPPIIQGFTINLLTQAGTPIPANKLYLSADYPGGVLVDALYRAVDVNKLVGDVQALGLLPGDKRNEPFLRWCGVAALPRELQLASYETKPSYKQFVLEQLRYPVRFSETDYEADSSVDLRSASLHNITTIDNLDRILAVADPHAIIAWAALDPRVERWHTQHDEKASLSVKLSSRSNPRYMRGQRVPSHVTWLLSCTPWLPANMGDLRAPARCTLATTLPEDLRTLLPRPQLDYEHPLFTQRELGGPVIRRSLERVGVSQSLDTLSWNEIYQLLLDLPQLDPKGNCARAVYRAVVMRSTDEDRPEGVVRERFMREGKMWSTIGQEGAYRPVTSIFYKSHDGLPNAIYRTLTLLDLDQGRGARKVPHLFGVEALSAENVRIIIDAYQSHPEAEKFKEDVRQLNPYIYALRIHADADASLKRLKDLEIRLCYSATGSAELPGKQGAVIELTAAGEFIIHDTHAYLVVAPNGETPDLHDPLIADKIGKILAIILRIDQASNFSRLITCPPRKRLPLLANMMDIDNNLNLAKELYQQARTKLQLPAMEDEDDVFPSRRMYIPPPSSNTPAAGSPEESTSSQTKEPSAANGDAVAPEAASATNHPTSVTNGPAMPASAASDPVSNEDKNPGDASTVNSTYAPAANQADIASVTAQEQPRAPISPSHEVPIRVSSTPTSGQRIVGPRRITDAARAEKLAERFEESDGQNRFPLPVSHLQGKLAFGCDILSFASSEDRDRFLQDFNTDWVARFIEVKGRGNPAAEIELIGNELAAAKSFSERFFIYRVYEASLGTFEVATLNNPLQVNVDVAYHINLLKQSSTREWIVTAKSAVDE